MKKNRAKQNPDRDTDGDAKGQCSAGSEFEEWKLHGISVDLIRFSVKRRKSRLPPDGERRLDGCDSATRAPL